MISKRCASLTRLCSALRTMVCPIRYINVLSELRPSALNYSTTPGTTCLEGPVRVKTEWPSAFVQAAKNGEACLHFINSYGGVYLGNNASKATGPRTVDRAEACTDDEKWIIEDIPNSEFVSTFTTIKTRIPPHKHFIIKVCSSSTTLFCRSRMLLSFFVFDSQAVTHLPNPELHLSVIRNSEYATNSGYSQESGRKISSRFRLHKSEST